jgi:hypothetical protein
MYQVRAEEFILKRRSQMDKKGLDFTKPTSVNKVQDLSHRN